METEILVKTNLEKEQNSKAEKKFEKPTLSEAIEFFKSENFSSTEAQKFFNYFESNGWKVGGKTPMKKWKAAARNWMLNSKNFITPQNFPNFPNYQKPQPKPKPHPNNKNYSEPL